MGPLHHPPPPGSAPHSHHALHVPKWHQFLFLGVSVCPPPFLPLPHSALRPSCAPPTSSSPLPSPFSHPLPRTGHEDRRTPGGGEGSSNHTATHCKSIANNCKELHTITHRFTATANHCTPIATCRSCHDRSVILQYTGPVTIYRPCRDIWVLSW